MIIVPEIADYEVRRSLLLEKLDQSIERLDLIESQFVFLPLTSSVMRRAAQLWAQARKRGRPTAAWNALDGDVILAAQAEYADATVVTDNAGHLSQFVPARLWEDML